MSKINRRDTLKAGLIATAIPSSLFAAPKPMWGTEPIRLVWERDHWGPVRKIKDINAAEVIEVWNSYRGDWDEVDISYSILHGDQLGTHVKSGSGDFDYVIPAYTPNHETIAKEMEAMQECSPEFPYYILTYFKKEHKISLACFKNRMKRMCNIATI